jgi:hypothetical protein
VSPVTASRLIELLLAVSIIVSLITMAVAVAGALPLTAGLTIATIVAMMWSAACFIWAVWA